MQQGEENAAGGGVKPENKEDDGDTEEPEKEKEKEKTINHGGLDDIENIKLDVDKLYILNFFNIYKYESRFNNSISTLV